MFSDNHKYIDSTPSAVTRRLRKRKLTGLMGLVFLGATAVFVANQWQPGDTPLLDEQGKIISKNESQTTAGKAQQTQRETSTLTVDKAFLRESISGFIEAGQFPRQLSAGDENLYLNYTLDQGLQDWATTRLQKYNPDYGVFVALDPDSGKILALATTRRDQQTSASLALRATYPAASTFKLITAAATIEEGLATPETKFSYNGKSTSLYKNQVYNVKKNKWTRNVSLKTAFAKSINPIFGRLGAEKLGPQMLIDYAERFGYNAQFISDFEFDNGRIEINLQDDWEAAESAAGYTRRNTLSPVHGAVIAAAIANGGKLISPSIVESVTNGENEVLYNAPDPVSIEAISEKTARAVQKLMRATITEGTGRKGFRSFKRKKFSDVVTGGKSGHLRGFNPKGSYDWFIGYGERDSRKIAYAVLSINKEKWYVKSSKFASEALEFYFKQPPAPKMATRSDKNQPAETS